MDCPDCGEPEMLFLPGDYYPEDDYQEPDACECPECGYTGVW